CRRTSSSTTSLATSASDRAAVVGLDLLRGPAIGSPGIANPGDDGAKKEVGMCKTFAAAFCAVVAVGVEGRCGICCGDAEGRCRAEGDFDWQAPAYNFDRKWHSHDHGQTHNGLLEVRIQGPRSRRRLRNPHRAATRARHAQDVRLPLYCVYLDRA